MFDRLPKSTIVRICVILNISWWGSLDFLFGLFSSGYLKIEPKVRCDNHVKMIQYVCLCLWISFSCLVAACPKVCDMKHMKCEYSPVN